MNVVIEQRYSFGLEPALLVFLGKVVVIHLEVESVSFLIEFSSFVRINFFVVESKFIVFELWNWKTCVEVNRRLVASCLTNNVLCIQTGEWSFLDIAKEVDTRSFNVWVKEVLVVVILEVMEVLMLAMWGAEKWGMWNFFWSVCGLNGVFDLSLLTEIVHVR